MDVESFYLSVGDTAIAMCQEHGCPWIKILFKRLLPVLRWGLKTVFKYFLNVHEI